ncbi:MAG: rhombosortase [Gammaproteobacteria bacterium]|nr:rhombosortase [Gammaproteobacteria bacterium]
MKTRWPLCTLMVLSMSVLASMWPAAVEALIYDRQAIQVGEVWRLLSGHLVHFSSAHLVGDLLVFGIAGYLIERQLGRQVGWLYLAMSAVIGLSLWVLDPALARFGGLSGLAYGNVFYMVASMAHQHTPARPVAVALLIVLLLKIFRDFCEPASVLDVLTPQPFVTVPLSHLVGVLMAGTFFIITTKENNHVPA